VSLKEFDSYLEMLASSLCAKDKRDLAKVKRYKEMPNKVVSPLSNP
jgi:hypothetical protein